MQGGSNWRSGVKAGERTTSKNPASGMRRSARGTNVPAEQQSEEGDARRLRVSGNLKNVIGQWHCRTVEEFIQLLAQNNVVTLNSLALNHHSFLNTEWPRNVVAGCVEHVANKNLKQLIEFFSPSTFVSILNGYGLLRWVTIFEVEATLLGDDPEWMTIVLDSKGASADDMKEAVEEMKGIPPRLQELYIYDKEWSGPADSWTTEQEEAALLPNNHIFSRACRIQVNINPTPDVLLEAVPKTEAKHTELLRLVGGIYEAASKTI